MAHGCMEPSNARSPAPAAHATVSAMADSNTLATAVVPTPALVVAEPAEPGPEFWARELEWARARFPELRDFTPEVDFAPLLEWVPKGQEVKLFISVDLEPHSVRCAVATAVRASDDYITMLVPEPARFEKGQILRRFSKAGAKLDGVDFNYSGGTQRKRADGTWEEVDSFATTGHDLGADVGPVVGDTAHFRYTDVRIDPWCGPKVRVSCADGGSQVCNLCEQVSVELRSPKSPVRGEPYEVTYCELPCPKLGNSELERIKRFAEHFPNGKVPSPTSLSVALYRTRAACKADPLWKPAKPASPKKTKAKP